MFSDIDYCFECMTDLSDYKRASKDLEQIQNIGDMQILNYPDSAGVISIGLTKETAEKEAISSSAGKNSDDILFGEFLVEFERFLRKFVVDRKVDIE